MHIQVPLTTISVLVPAAGCGARAALNGNKILALIHDQPLLWWTLRALSAQKDFEINALQPGIADTTTDANCSDSQHNNGVKLIEFVIAARDQECEIVQRIWDTAKIDLPMRLVNGGATRADSVENCVDAARGDYVLVHDAARPCLTPEVTERVIAAALQGGAAIAALPVNDTVKVVQGRGIQKTLDRSMIYLAQTPQIFRREWLREALSDARQNSFTGTDCASYVERWLHRHEKSQTASADDKDASGTDCETITVVDGDENNFKVTYATDVERAASLVQKLK